MYFKKIMKCTDKSFIINTTILHIKRRFFKFDFMPTLTQVSVFFLTFDSLKIT